MDYIERIGRELKHTGSILKMYDDTIKTPNGNIAHWDFVEHSGAAAVVPVTEDGKILMVRQYRNALDRFTLEIPAGGINGGEPSDIAAARELEEETGYKSSNITKLISIVTAVAFCNEIIDVYVAKDLVKTQQNLDEDEFIDVAAYSLDELKKMIKEEKIQDSKTISALLAYEAFAK